MPISPGLVQFCNCRILYHGEILHEDFWVRNGKIMNPEELFYDEKVTAEKQIDCDNMLIVPGYIDVQINGGFGYDFSSNIEVFSEGLDVVSKGLLQHGVTSFCPTLVTSPVNVYRQVLPKLKRRPGGKHGAEIIGAHCEGPFINFKKKGAHDESYIKTDVSDGLDSFINTYGSLENVSIITVAPEIPGINDCIKRLVERNIVVSIGHSMGNLTDGEKSVCNGASFITHLFNAMLPFHHRDPGIVGVLTSLITPKQAFYGLISDGIHTHPTALRIAQRSHPKGIVLITDAIAALGLPPGEHKLGTMDMMIDDKVARIKGTDTLAGSISSMDKCVRHFKKGAGCGVVEAIEAATLHPAQMLVITDRKGTLDHDTDADFIFLDDNLAVHATFIAGEPVWINENSSMAKLNNCY